MHSNQNHKWNDNACDTNPVGLGAPGSVAGIAILDGFSDLVGEGSGNRAGEISRANRLSLSEAKESKVLGRGVSVSVATGSWCCPSGDSLAIANKLQGETSVNVFDSAKTDFTDGQWVVNDNRVGFDVDLGEDVVSPNQSQQEQHNRACSQTVLLIEPNGLNHGQSSQNKARYGNYVARSRSLIHSQILSRQEANYVAG
jgi:hypothetical protein